MRKNNILQNKLKFPKSIFIHYLPNGISFLRVRLCNLDPKPGPSFNNNERATINELSNRNNNKLQKFRTATIFKFEPHGTGLSFTLEVPALYDIHTQMLLLWKQTLQNLAKTCKWTELQLSTVLKNSISPLLGNIIDKASTSDQIFKIINSQIYDSSNLNSRYNKLKRTTQTDFITIDEYYNQVYRIHHEFAQTTGQSEQEATNRTNESYYTNLHYIPKLEMERQGVSNIGQIYQRVQKIKKMLLEQLNEIRQGLNIDSRDDRTAKISDKNQEKYCRYHMTKSHSSEECRAIKKSSKRNQESRKEKNNMIIESYKALTPLAIPITLNEKSISALLDTGASGNSISSQMVKELNIKKQGKASKTMVTLGDGSVSEINQCCEIEFQIQKLKLTRYRDKFDILPS